MANPHRGEVEFVSDGRTYTMVFTVNAVCHLERVLGISISKIGDVVGNNARMEHVVEIVRAGLLKHHPGLTPEDVGDVMDGAGLPEIMRAVEQAFRLSSVGGGDPAANPRTPKASRR